MFRGSRSSTFAFHRGQAGIGVLADTWTISDDKMTYTFKLNPAAKWSDGQPVTAEDVQFYYDVMMNPKNMTSLFRVDLSRFDRPEAVDERTRSGSRQRNRIG